MFFSRAALTLQNLSVLQMAAAQQPERQ
ncbi:hypothetical protein HaLaN_29004 [Haematococcus lacustris]|uniref:Uncharacterized protein n=1 Tax=Haematococcus lacustris TaxID=44745 RepID=A0A6A0ABJ3_HAELA|nr:hypothetical protein HaLaN_29004 [Haematococcus lacustris]